MVKRLADGGVYRQYIIDHRPSDMTQRNAKAAIALAKRDGMYSVPEMRNIDGDTWYQFEGALENQGGNDS